MSDLKDGKIKVALDWTPNTNHIGMYVAAYEGLYAAAGLTVTFLDPTECKGSITPPRQVAAGTATFAVGSSESAISFATTSPDKPRLKAVAALLQGSTSAICTLQSSGIDSPAKLSGKRFASYCGRFADAIVRAMVNQAGGDGSKVLFHPLADHGYGDPDIAEVGSVVASNLEGGLADAVWIFSHWEGILASRAGQKLNEFHLEDYNIPYGYTPVLLCHPNTLTENIDQVRAFLTATARGYEIAAADPARGAKALCECGHPSLKDHDFVEESARVVAPSFLDGAGRWGTMTIERWQAFFDFLAENKILMDREGLEIPRSAVNVSELFTNAGLPSK